MRTQHKADCKELNITWKHFAGLSPKPTPQLLHSSIFLCFQRLLFPCSAFAVFFSRFIKSYAFSQSCIGFYQWACYWYSLLQWLQWNGADFWVVRYIEEVSRKTERYIRGRKKGWVADEACKDVWQVNFSTSLKKKNLIYFLSPVSWLENGYLATLMSCRQCFR